MKTIICAIISGLCGVVVTLFALWLTDTIEYKMAVKKVKTTKEN